MAGAGKPPMLTLRTRRTLGVDPAVHPRGRGHLSAASGLVRVGLRCHVIADDEHHLGTFGADDAAPLSLLRLFDGALPVDAKRRKQRKPDLEVLLGLPATADRPRGALLALGSGSRPNRHRGVVVPLDADGAPGGAPQALDLDALYSPIARALGKVNIEGGFFGGGECRLLQRGNDAGGTHAAVVYDAAAFAAWVATPSAVPPRPRSIVAYDLGAVEGVPYGFTDGAALPGGAWMFSAVAEATDDSYVDGACVASMIGFVAADGMLGRMHRLAGAPKVEGLTGGIGEGRLHVMAVTDADDPEELSQLLCGEADWTEELTGFRI